MYEKDFKTLKEATEASKMYNKDFGYSFSVQDRFTAAVEMEEYYKEDQVFYDL